jgi:NADH-quinone oxidoreductase subunit M
VNQLGFPILSLMLAIPLLRRRRACSCPTTARAGSRSAPRRDLALGILLWATYDIGWPAMAVHRVGFNFGAFQYALGIDGIALMLILLSVFLMPICIAAAWSSIEHRIPEYMARFLLMETLMIGVFAAQDIFLFYIFFEAGLIPMYLIIGIWGGAQRIYASYKFFLYTLLGSVLMLVAMLWMVNFAGTTSIPRLLNTDFPPRRRPALARFLRSFAVKMPMWPVHTWLPDAHVQAPTAARHPGRRAPQDGRLRLHPLLAADVSGGLGPALLAGDGAVMVAIVYASLVALVQKDMKKLIAYSSVAHMAFVTIGLFAFNRRGSRAG